MTDPLWFPGAPRPLRGPASAKFKGLISISLVAEVQVSHSMKLRLWIPLEWSLQDFKILCYCEEFSGISSLSYFLLPNVSTPGPNQ